MRSFRSGSFALIKDVKRAAHLYFINPVDADNGKRPRSASSPWPIDGYMVFGLMTYGGKNKWYMRDLEGIARTQRATYIGTYGACGYDTFGPFKLVGGVMKGHPTAEEVQGAADWYKRLVEEYGGAIQNEYVKRREREA